MRVIFTPEATDALIALRQYLQDVAGEALAKRYVAAVVSFCESLGEFAPERGNRRDDLRPGLRITHYKGRVVIAFSVEPDQVAIIGVFSGGQDYEALLDER